jgi:hypothetical protein
MSVPASGRFRGFPTPYTYMLSKTVFHPGDSGQIWEKYRQCGPSRWCLRHCYRIFQYSHGVDPAGQDGPRVLYRFRCWKPWATDGRSAGTRRAYRRDLAGIEIRRSGYRSLACGAPDLESLRGSPAAQQKNILLSAFASCVLRTTERSQRLRSSMHFPDCSSSPKSPRSSAFARSEALSQHNLPSVLGSRSTSYIRFQTRC